MINLLPPVEKEAVMYARYNTQLRRWIIGAIVGLVGVVVVVLGGQMYLRQGTQDYQRAVNESEERLAKQDQKATLGRVKGIQESFKLVVDVLSRQVLFSKLLPRVGAIMPEGVILQDFSLNNDGKQAAFDITASAVNYQTASQIQVNLEDPANKLFEKADLINITCTSSDAEGSEEGVSGYPCQAQVRVQPAKDNEFLLLSPEVKR